MIGKKEIIIIFFFFVTRPLFSYLSTLKNGLLHEDEEQISSFSFNQTSLLPVAYLEENPFEVTVNSDSHVIS